jgi:hypothetical protein
MVLNKIKIKNIWKYKEFIKMESIINLNQKLNQQMIINQT